MLLKTPSIMDDLVINGALYHFMGANKADKTLRLMDENGQALFIKCVGDRNKYTAFETLPDPEKPPRGMSRSLGPVRVAPYDKEDATRGIRTVGHEIKFLIEDGQLTSTPSGISTVSEPIWTRGYRLIDMRGNGHVWLTIGHHNYKSAKGCRAIFQYNVLDLDEEEDLADDE